MQLLDGARYMPPERGELYVFAVPTAMAARKTQEHKDAGLASAMLAPVYTGMSLRAVTLSLVVERKKSLGVPAHQHLYLETLLHSCGVRQADNFWAVYEVMLPDPSIDNTLSWYKPHMCHGNYIY